MHVEQASFAVTPIESGLSLRLLASANADPAGLHRDFQSVVDARPGRVHLDLTDCDCLSSAAIGAIMGLYSKMKSNGGSVRITAIRRMVLTSFRFAHLDQFFGIGPEAILPR